MKHSIYKSEWTGLKYVFLLIACLPGYGGSPHRGSVPRLGSQDTFREEAIAGIDRAMHALPNGHFVFEDEVTFYHLEDGENRAILEYLTEGLVVTSAADFGGNSDVSSIFRPLFEKRAEEMLGLVTSTNDKELRRSRTFDFNVSEGIIDYSQEMDYIGDDERTDGSAYLLLQIQASEIIVQLKADWTARSSRSQSVSVYRMPKPDDPLLRQAPSHIRLRTVGFSEAVRDSFLKQGEHWAFVETKGGIEATFDVKSPKGPWPSLPFSPLVHASGTFVVGLDGKSGSVASFDVIDSQGNTVESMWASDFFSDEFGSFPLGLIWETFWPTSQLRRRSIERYSGIRSDALPPRALAILVPTGASVIDSRVTPSVEYTEGLLPVSDSKLISISAEGAKASVLRPAPKRTEKHLGSSPLFIDRVDSGPNSDGDERLGGHMFQLLGGALVLLGFFRIYRRRNLNA